MKLLFVLCALVAVMPSGYPRDDANAMLQAARSHLGGNELDRVRSLEVERNGTLYRLAFPSRFQTEVPTPFGRSVTTLAGDVVWQVDPPTPPGGAQPMPRSMEWLVNRERTRMAEFAAIYLLRPLPPSKFEVLDLGMQTFWDLTGRVLELRSPASDPVRLVVDSVSNRPLALVWRRRISPSPEPCDLVARLEDYRDVGGLRFPFLVRFQIVNQGKNPDRALARYSSARIDVNPVFSLEMFRKPGLRP